MSCEAAGVDGSDFVSKARQARILESRSRDRRIAPCCLEVALAQIDYGDDVPETLRQSLQKEYDQQSKEQP